MAENNIQEYMTRADVAVILGVSTDTLREMAKKGEGPPVVRFSPRKALYPVIDLVKFLKARTGGAVS